MKIRRILFWLGIMFLLLWAGQPALADDVSPFALRVVGHDLEIVYHLSPAYHARSSLLALPAAVRDRRWPMGRGVVSLTYLGRLRGVPVARLTVPAHAQLWQGKWTATLDGDAANFRPARHAVWRRLLDVLLETSIPAPVHAPTPATTGRDAVFRVLRMRCAPSGVHVLTGAQIIAAGLRPTAETPFVQVSWHRQLLPLAGPADRPLTAASRYYFYLPPDDSPYARTASCLVRLDDRPGPLVRREENKPVGSYQFVAWTEKQFVEAHLYRSALDGANGPWFWLSFNGMRDAQISFDLAQPTPWPVDAVLTLHVTAASPPDFTAVLNNYPLVPTSIQAEKGGYAVRFLVNQTQTPLRRANTLHLHNRYFTPMTYLAQVDIRYLRTLAPADEQVAFIAQPGRHYYILPGVAPDDLWLWDVAQWRDPVEMTHFETVKSKLGTDVIPVMAPPAGEGEHTYLFGNQRALYASPLTFVAEDDLRASANQADYLVIGPAAFADAVQPLLAAREAEGLHSRYVDVQAIYDQFNDGEPSPVAIRDFIAYAYHHWQLPTLGYVLLLGKGHYDYRRFLPGSPAEWVPPYMDDLDPWLGYVADESYFAAVDGDDVLPDLFLGRLPVANAAEVSAVVAKILRYRAQPPWQRWQRRQIVLADAPSNAPFTLLASELAGHIPSYYETEEVFKEYEPDGATLKRRISETLSSGALLYYYVGHARVDSLGARPMFSLADVGALSPTAGPPFWLALSCLSGDFFLPGHTSLLESLLQKEDGGIIGALAPTGNGIAPINQIFGLAFQTAMEKYRLRQLGGASVYARLILLRDGGNYGLYLAQLFALLGDPALSLPAPPPGTWLPFVAGPSYRQRFPVYVGK